MFLEHRQFEELKSLTPAQKKKFMATQLNALGELLGGGSSSAFGEEIGRNRLEVVLIGVVGIVGQVSKMIRIPPSLSLYNVNVVIVVILYMCEWFQCM